MTRGKVRNAQNMCLIDGTITPPALNVGYKYLQQFTLAKK